MSTVTRCANIWQKSYLFSCGNEAWILVTKDTSIYVSKPRKEDDVKMKPEFQGIAFPKRLLNGPFQEWLENPMLRTSFWYKNKIVVVFGENEVHKIEPLATPRWTLDAQSAEFTLTHVLEIEDGMLMDVMRTDKSGDVLVLVGKETQGVEGLSVCLYHIKREKK